LTSGFYHDKVDLTFKNERQTTAIWSWFFYMKKIAKGENKMKKVILSLVVGCGFSILLTGYETNKSEVNKKISTFNQTEVQNMLTNIVTVDKTQEIVWNQAR